MNGEDSANEAYEPDEGQDGAGRISEDGAPICLGCAAPVTTNTRYCPKCGRPVGMFVGTDPMQLIHSQSWAYRAAASGRPTRIVFWGMWLAFGPTTVMSLGTLWDLVRYGAEGANGVVGALLILGLEAIYVALLWRVSKNYIRHRRYRSGKCGVCKYDLRFLTEPRCPECGTQFDPEWLPEGPEWSTTDRNST
jgi:RNA polymerase subunit RPABC4/transcription elongation factor Spt4